MSVNSMNLNSMKVSSQPLPLDGNAREVFHGLTSRPKQLPPKLFYDAAGSALFEQITELPEYYLTVTEQTIFERHARDMVRAAGEASTIIELGAGTAKKTMLILRAALDSAMARLDSYPSMFPPLRWKRRNAACAPSCRKSRCNPLVLDYTQRSPALAQLPGRKLVLYIGSSIGNFEPMAASALLRRLRSWLAPGDSLLLGTDMRKPADVLLPAYDDASGVTAQFNLNVLARINREFDADFDLNRFAHSVTWNERRLAYRNALSKPHPSVCPHQSPGLIRSLCLGRDDSYREQLQVHCADDRIDGRKRRLPYRTKLERRAQLVHRHFASGRPPHSRMTTELKRFQG